MIKEFCDICEKEIPKTDLQISVFTSTKYAMQGKGMAPVKYDEMFCTACTSAIKEKIEEFRKKK